MVLLVYFFLGVVLLFLIGAIFSRVKKGKLPSNNLPFDVIQGIFRKELSKNDVVEEDSKHASKYEDHE